jgi:hypothetical protein
MEMNSVSETLADVNRLAPLSAQDFIDFFYCGSSRQAVVEKPLLPVGSRNHSRPMYTVNAKDAYL